MPSSAKSGSRQRCRWLLETALRQIRAQGPFPEIVRMSAVEHTPRDDMLKALAFAGQPCPYLDGLSTALSDLPGLDFGTQGGRKRIIHDIGQLGDRNSQHIRALLDAGIRSSMTVALRDATVSVGYLFVNSARPGYFSPDVVSRLGPPVGQTILLLRRELRRQRQH